MKTEQELANELDAFLTAKIKGRPVSPPEDSQVEEHFVNALIDLAAKNEPGPLFLSNLEAQLAGVASRQQKEKKAPKRPSFWQQMISFMEESFTPKQTVFALGTAIAVIIVGVFVLNRLFPQGGTEPAAVAVIPTLASKAIVPTAENSAETIITEAMPLATATTADLPLLPHLSGGGGSFGGGGGGAITAGQPVTDEEHEAILPPFDPLSDTHYVLNAALPIDPQFAPVFQQSGENGITLTELRDFAARFGIDSAIYTEAYPIFDVAPSEEVWTPPNFYFMFDGTRMVSAWDTTMQYYDQGLAPDLQAEMLAYEQALPIAETYLQERGLLNFEYQVLAPPYGGNEVNFHRVIDGRLVNIAEYTITVNSNGQILSVYYNPLNRLQSLGDYPLRSAESAWQQITQEGIDYRHRTYFTYPGPNFEFPAEPVDGPYQYWQRTYVEGEAINLFTSPVVYRPVEASTAPRIQADQFVLSANDEVLQAIAEQIGQQIKVTGVVRYDKGSLILEVSEWQLIEFIEYQYMQGTIRRNDEQTLFEADLGETFLIPGAPADLPDGERVNVNGWSLEPGEPYRLFNWQGIDRIIAFEPPPSDLGLETGLSDPYRLGQVEVTSVDLIYAHVVFIGDERSRVEVFLQPVWRFRGATDTNEIIELLVQAVTDEFLGSDTGD